MSSSPTKVGGIILDNQNNLLIVLGKYSQKWGVPKGTLEEDESMLEGALREIKEETGLKLNPISTKHLEYWAINRARLYLLQVDEKKPYLYPDDQREIVKARWLDFNNPYQMKYVTKHANKMLLAVIKRINQCMN